MDRLIVKFSFDGGLHRATVASPTISALEATVAAVVGPVPCRLQYLDDDGDFVRVATDSDVLEALAFSQATGKALRLEVSVRSDGDGDGGGGASAPDRPQATPPAEPVESSESTAEARISLRPVNVTVDRFECSRQWPPPPPRVTCGPLVCACRNMPFHRDFAVQACEDGGAFSAVLVYPDQRVAFVQQLVRQDVGEGPKLWLWSRWFSAGEEGAAAFKGPFTAAAEATARFTDLFLAKSGVHWPLRRCSEMDWCAPLPPHPPQRHAHSALLIPPNPA